MDKTTMIQERKIEDKNILVTGGASGIGLCLAEHFLMQGAKQIALLDVDTTKGEQAAKYLSNKFNNAKVSFMELDICDDNKIESVFDEALKQLDTIDVVVNGAGILNDRNGRKTIETNLIGLIALTLKAWDTMRRDRGGRGGTIINIASIYGLRNDPYFPVYQASKFGVVGFSKSLGLPFHYDRTGVRILTLCPGFTDTPMTTRTENKFLDHETEIEFEKAKTSGEITLQTAQSVAAGTVDMFERGDSGTVWLVENGNPAVQV